MSSVSFNLSLSFVVVSNKDLYVICIAVKGDPMCTQRHFKCNLPGQVNWPRQIWFLGKMYLIAMTPPVDLIELNDENYYSSHGSDSSKFVRIKGYTEWCVCVDDMGINSQMSMITDSEAYV